MKSKLLYPVFLFLLITSYITTIGQTTSITVGKSSSGKVDIKGFSLKENSKIKISGTGALNNKFGNNGYAYGWILNSETREVVWSLYNANEISDKSHRRMFDFKKEIALNKGDYEVYYVLGENFGIGKFIDEVLNIPSANSISRNSKNYFMNVGGLSGIFVPNDGKDIVDLKAKNAVVSFNRVKDNQRFKKGFTLTGEAKIRVYCIGEGRGSGEDDYGWIADAKTNKKIWSLEPEHASHAGGGNKNVYDNKDLILPAGSYMVYYVSDDSHSFQEWNVMPPSDPQFYGITLWLMSPDDYKKVRPIQENDIPKPIVEFSRVKNSQNLSKGFTLTEASDIRVLCLGESSGNEMADYGWITNADTHETIWKMENQNSVSAGGASKNKMINQVIPMKKGNYILHYISDDSHSYNDWNDNPPYDQDRWGISIWASNEKELKNVKTFEPEKYRNKNVIVQITEVGNDENIIKDFYLDHDSNVRIYAIGEGMDNEMTDYGWIKNKDTGNKVWEMRYNMTNHAGGASKNRQFNGTMNLKKGSYTVHFESDDSHSYKNWNDSPPDDPDMYGITLYYDKN